MKAIPNYHHRGFTLVELLVVIVIIATLVSLSIGAVFRFRKASDKALVLNNMRQLQSANIAYSSDNQGMFVPPEDEIDSATYKWFENPDLISQIKGEGVTYSSSGGAPDTSLPIGMMDPYVVREKPAGYENFSKSYAYTTPLAEEPVIVSQVTDPSRSAAFITADTDGFVDNATRANIAYRHENKAVVVFFGGNASLLTEADIAAIQNKGGATNVFWQAVN